VDAATTAGRQWAADVADDALDPDEVAPLFAALHDSSGDARATILEALVRLPLAADDVRKLGVAPPAQVPPARPQWGDGELPGFTTHSASAWADLDARLETLELPENSLLPTSPALEEEIAPAAGSRWFASSVGDYPNVGLGNVIVGWVSAYEGSFRPDLDGLFAQYRRAALAECAAWEGDQRPGTWFLRNPDFEGWYGYRSLCWQIGWTVSRGGLRGLVPGLARPLAAEDETERTIAALLIADAADYLLSAEPPIFGGGYGPPTRPPAGAADPATLPHLLRDAARAGVVPARATPAPAPSLPPATPAPAPSRPPPAPPEPEFDELDELARAPTSPSTVERPRAPAPSRPTRGGRAGGVGGLGAALVALALLGGAAIAKWVFGWFTTTIDVDAPGLDDIQCTVFAPPVAAAGSTILVQVFAHVPKEADDARAIATELDVGAVRRGFRSLDASVPVGGRLDFELRIAGLEIDDPVASLTWHGRTEAVQFGVHIPPAAPVGTVIGTVSISRDGAPLVTSSSRSRSRPAPSVRRPSPRASRHVATGSPSSPTRRRIATRSCGGCRCCRSPEFAISRTCSISSPARSGRAGSSRPSGTTMSSCSSGRAAPRSRRGCARRWTSRSPAKPATIARRPRSDR
jgi:hypothetical protein